MSEINYFNGSIHIEAYDINKLADLSQEEANNLACGPQDLFFEKLTRVNNELRYYGIEPIDVTDKWNWKPGSYDKIKEYLYKKLELNKKAMSVSKIMLRAHDRINYMGYIQRQANEMELEKANLKRLGVGRDVDIDKFKETCIKFVDELIDNCQTAFELTEEKVLIVPYISLNEGRDARLYLDISLKDLTLEIYDGKDTVKLIQKIPLNPLHIIISMPLRHRLSNQKTKIDAVGYCQSKSVQLTHPYISSRYRNSDNYGSVCLDMYHDEIEKACLNSNMVNLAATLLQWSQYYNIKRANPFNQPHNSHIGLPEEYSKEYKSILSTESVGNSCGSRLHRASHDKGERYFEIDETISSICNSVNCSLKNICDISMQIQKRTNNLSNEWGCQIESFVMMVADWLFDEYGDAGTGDLSAMQHPIEMLIGNTISYAELDEEEYKLKVINRLLWYYASSSNQKFDVYVYNFLENYNFIDKEPEKVPSVKDMGKEELETLMKSWAESQGRSV